MTYHNIAENTISTKHCKYHQIFRAHAKVQKKAELNNKALDNLEEKLQKDRGFSDWDKILELSFEVTNLQDLWYPIKKKVYNPNHKNNPLNYPYFEKDLSEKLQTGELSSLEALHAFQWKAIQLNKKQNCIVHLIEDAEDEARKRDQVPVKGKTAN